MSYADEKASVPQVAATTQSLAGKLARYYQWDPTATPTNVAPQSMSRPKELPQPLDRRERPFLTKVQRGWSKLSRRTIITILAVALVTLSIIIGLSVGLPKHHTAKIALRSQVPRSDPIDVGSFSLATPRSVPADVGPFTGDMTYYDPAMGSCGITSTSDQPVVAISHVVFDAAQVGANPNNNPLCGQKILAQMGDKSVVLTVVDRCVGCAADDLDVSETAFASLADTGLGRVTITWSWVAS